MLVYRLTGSALYVGLMLMATALPSLLVGLIAGVFVDRWDRKRIMFAADLSRAALVSLVPLSLAYGIGWLYLIVVLSSTIAQFFEPAQASVLPELATDEELAAANALTQVSSFGATAVGFAASGLIISLLSISWAFYLDALSFLVSAACIAVMRIPHSVVEDKTSVDAVLRNLRTGLRVLFHTPLLRSLFIICVPVFLGYGLHNAVLLPFAIRSLNASEFEYGLMEGVEAAGFIISALLLIRLVDRLHEGQWVALSYLAIGVSSLVMAMLSSVPPAIVLSLCVGFVNAPNYIGRSLVIQRNTSREVRGRVNSAFLVARNAMYVVGMAAAGLGDLVDIRWLLIASGLLVGLSGALVLFMPGLGQPAAEWRQAAAMLRMARSAPGLGLGHAATQLDLDLLLQRLPMLGALSLADRRQLVHESRVHVVPIGTAVVRHGDVSDAAFFILEGRAVAGRDEGDVYRRLEVLNAGDFFGEIAALTGVPRTADVVAEQPATLLRVPPSSLRRLMNNPQINPLFLSKMTERMVRMNMIDLPRFAGIDQTSLRELRTPEPQPAT